MKQKKDDRRLPDILPNLAVRGSLEIYQGSLNASSARSLAVLVAGDVTVGIRVLQLPTSNLLGQAYCIKVQWQEIE